MRPIYFAVYRCLLPIAAVSFLLLGLWLISH